MLDQKMRSLIALSFATETFCGHLNCFTRNQGHLVARPGLRPATFLWPFLKALHFGLLITTEFRIRTLPSS